MLKIIVAILLFSITVLTFFGCSKKENDETSDTVLEKIDADKANEMMSQEDVIILDVRTEEEFNEGHIDGAILIPDYEITNQSEKILEDKSATILVYCRSGRRSALAAKELHNIGYTSIYDFGGIIDWPYEVVKE